LLTAPRVIALRAIPIDGGGVFVEELQGFAYHYDTDIRFFRPWA